ncbi:MAG: sulfatase [Planctomycetota bacterium]
MTRPNILLVTDDQHRFDFYGGGRVAALQTPHFDRLKAEGVTLANSFSNCPICMPTRFTWCYGLYANQGATRLTNNRHSWPTHLKSMPSVLQEQGYHTALVGKLHSHQGLYQIDLCDHVEEARARGFDDVLETSGKSLAYWLDCNWTHHLARRGLLDRYRQDCRGRMKQLGGQERYEPSFLAPEDTMDGYIGDQCRRWLERYDSAEPFFLHASFCGPHFPLDPATDYFRQYTPDQMPEPECVADPQSARRWQELRAVYCALITQVDEEIGRLIATLQQQGLLEDTIIFFASDHGDMIGHHDRFGKGPAYDTSCRTPCIVRLPGRVNAGTVLNDLVEAVDLPCTIMEAAGCGDDPGALLPSTPGRSFWKYLHGAAVEHRQWAYAEMGAGLNGGPDGWRMCRDRRWKYVMDFHGPDTLYDLQTDPWECCNLADDPAQAERISLMRRRLIESMGRCVAPNLHDPIPRDDWWPPSNA